MEVQLHSTLTSTTDGMSGQLYVPTALPPGKESVVPTEQKAGWAPEPVFTFWRRYKYVASGGNRTTIPRTSSQQPSHYPSCYRCQDTPALNGSLVWHLRLIDQSQTLRQFSFRQVTKCVWTESATDLPCLPFQQLASCAIRIHHHHHHHHWLDSPWWALAFLRSFAHSFMSRATFLQFLISSILIS